jgi:2-polyprenyl-3-methyl-5-hydroxy-6-metoxy-1,4-benzoquinol methylase
VLDADGNVVSPNELVARVEQLLRSTPDSHVQSEQSAAGTHQPSHEMTVAHTNALHVLQHQLVVPGVDSPPGVTAPAKRTFKRVIRKLTWWYVEPRWRVQNDFDAHSAHFASAVTTELSRLSTEMDQQRQRHREQQLRLAVQISTAFTKITELQQAVDSAVRHQLELSDLVKALSTSTVDHEQLNDVREDAAAVHVELSAVRKELVSLLSRLDLAASTGADVNYVSFADQFRATTVDRSARRQYLQWLPSKDVAGAIIDIGCGRGDMLEVLQVNGFDAMGVDQDALMVAHCKRRGFDVTEDNALRFLDRLDDGSVGAILCLQVIDHLMTSELEILVELCQRKLARGGVLIVESINPLSLHAFANHFLTDLTHLKAVPPESLAFICTQIGFEKVDTIDVARHPYADLGDNVPDGHTREALSRLLSTVYGFTDYVVVATK